MPIQSYSSFRRLINLTKCVVPENILRDLDPIKVGVDNSKSEPQLGPCHAWRLA
jgi:methylenetetrahydrofolate reductase (NADPH)